MNAFAATDHFKIEEQATLVEEGEEIQNIEEIPYEDATRSGAHFKNGFDGQGLHLRSNFTENLTSHLSLTRSHNFLDIDLQAVTGEEYTIVEGRVDPSSYAVNYFHYEIKINAPVYTLREDVSYRLNPTLQLESGFLYAFNPAKSSENGWVEENFESEPELR